VVVSDIPRVVVAGIICTVVMALPNIGQQGLPEWLVLLLGSKVCTAVVLLLVINACSLTAVCVSRCAADHHQVSTPSRAHAGSRLTPASTGPALAGALATNAGVAAA
jgi:hypothetical protein